MTSFRYRTEGDFRRALERRLTTLAEQGSRGLLRERQVLLFERFLARAIAADMDVVIKGGMAIELRTVRARTTRDIDLRAMGAPDRFDAALRALSAMDLGDHLLFRIELHRRPELDAIGMRYPGRRYRAQAMLANKVYGDPFGVDVAFGEPMLGAAEHVQGRSDLSFIGVETPTFAIYPRATHIAEKLHAYTVPRPTPNSRVRDLPDLAILASVGPIEAQVVRTAIEQTFAHRGTHALPSALADAPDRWREPYHELAEANRLPWKGLSEVQQAAQRFLDPVLGGVEGVWDDVSWCWTLPSSNGG